MNHMFKHQICQLKQKQATFKNTHLDKNII